MQYLGIARYLLNTVIPSAFKFGVSSDGENYYKKPWEASASLIGGDWDRGYTWGDVIVSGAYLFTASFGNPIWSCLFAFWGW